MKRWEYSIFDLCNDLHGLHTGSMCASREQEEEMLETLRARLADWRPSTGWRDYDEAVRRLIIATLTERNALSPGGGRGSDE